jgi:hypothetical protein
MSKSNDNYASVIRRTGAYAVDALILFIAFPIILGAICGFVLYLTIGLDGWKTDFFFGFTFSRSFQFRSGCFIPCSKAPRGKPLLE